MRTARLLLITSSALALGVACTSTETSASDDAVEVTLQNDAVTLDPTTTAAGSVTFSATNEGTETHEIEVFRNVGDVDPNALPIADGVASTDGLELLDEIEDITPGGNADLTVDLASGSYVVMCNLPDHYGRGMVSSFEVT